MQNESQINPTQLQRLIDGELSEAEVLELAALAEQDPSLWRTIGCAFTEDQLFRKQFESFVAEVEHPKSAKALKPVKPVKQSDSTDESTFRSSGSSRSVPWVWQLTTAACFALAGLIGYLVGSDATPIPDMSSPEMIASTQTDVEPLTPVDLKPEYRMELLTPDGEVINGEVDLYRYNDLHRLVGDDKSNRRVKLQDVLPPSGFSAEARQRLSRSGYDIDESTNYMSGRLQDGRQFVVPVRSIRFDQGH